MKLVLKMTTDEIKKRHGKENRDKLDFIYCDEDCPCWLEEDKDCFLAGRYGAADGFEVCYKRIQECTKTETDYEKGGKDR